MGIFSRTTMIAMFLKNTHVHVVACGIGTVLAASPLLAQSKEESLEQVVVTASRVAIAVDKVPQKIEIISAEEIEKSVSLDVTDALKKNAGIDVIQYNGMLSGIGIRGFRPEFSGINKRSLLLIDGRPAGSTNLSTIMLDNVDRIEVLKGPASSLYGASAMGGVVNIITRRSTGPLQGAVGVGVGSFDTYEVKGHAGGHVRGGLDFDITGKRYDRGDDYRMGRGDDEVNKFAESDSGQVRPFTQFSNDHARLRLGYALNPAWRVDASGEGFRSRDVLLPGDEYEGDSSQSKKDLDRSNAELRLGGDLGSHLVEALGYTAREAGNNIKVKTSVAADQPYLPYLSYESETQWKGAQLRDTWRWRQNAALTGGVDYEDIGVQSRSFSRTGQRVGPSSADSRKTTLGFYAQQQLELLDGRTTASVGLRYDRITMETLETPYKTGFTPGATTFNTFNPSIGITHELMPGLRARATYGTAFVPADVSYLTGYSQNDSTKVITMGNSSLKPEKSRSYDVGLLWRAGRFETDLTYFHTKVTNRISGQIPTTSPLVGYNAYTYANAYGALLRGLELGVRWSVTRNIAFDVNATHYLTHDEDVKKNGVVISQQIQNVADTTVTAGLSATAGKVEGRLGARFVNGRTDTDWNDPEYPIIGYPSLTVLDLHGGYQLTDAVKLSLDISNLLDEYYYEKKGYALEGRSLMLRAAWSF